MKKLFSTGNLRALLIILLIVGVFLLSIGGYLAPLYNFSLTPLISTQSWLSMRFLAFKDYFTAPRDIASLQGRNSELEVQVSQLQSQIIELQEKLSESQVLYALLDFARSNPQHEYVAATVIGREISPFIQYVIIDKGTNQGIRHGMPVVTQQGLVGRIDAVIANASRVQLISDANSIVNVQLQSGKIDAQLRGTLTGEIVLEMIPQDAVIEPGEVLLTSGLGGNYPSNIFIGQVLSIHKLENALFQSASVHITPLVP
jgi:rod shape-determining protein MreC